MNVGFSDRISSDYNRIFSNRNTIRISSNKKGKPRISSDNRRLQSHLLQSKDDSKSSNKKGNRILRNNLRPLYCRHQTQPWRVRNFIMLSFFQLPYKFCWIPILLCYWLTFWVSQSTIPVQRTSLPFLSPKSLPSITATKHVTNIGKW